MDIDSPDPHDESVGPPGPGENWGNAAADREDSPVPLDSPPVWYESTGGILPPLAAAPHPRRRRVILPLLLFLATCLTTFMSGTFTGAEVPDEHTKMESVVDILRYGWPAGLKYMVAVMSILLA